MRRLLERPDMQGIHMNAGVPAANSPVIYDIFGAHYHFINGFDRQAAGDPSLPLFSDSEFNIFVALNFDFCNMAERKGAHGIAKAGVLSLTVMSLPAALRIRIENQVC